MDAPLLPLSTPAASGGEDATAGDVGPAPASLVPASSPPTSTVVVRLATFFALATLSLWASSEASRGFSLDVVNAAGAGTAAGRRFDLMFASNGRASRAVLDASRAVQRALYPAAGTTKKQVRHVTLRLADGNLPASVVVVQRRGGDEFVVHVSSTVMLAADVGRAMGAAVRRGMARVWLWDGRGAAPEALLDAMADYLETLDGAGAEADRVDSGDFAAEENLCWPPPPPSSQGGDAAVGFVRRCEEKRRGFVARLNSAMRGRWRAGMVEEALGSPAGRVCRSQNTTARERGADGSVGGGAAGWTGTDLRVTSVGWASG